MARVTVEDCAEIVPSRFELVALAAQRAKTISAGGDITLERENDKDAVIALREIAEGTVDVDILRESVIQNRQEKVNVDRYGVEEMNEESDTIETADIEVTEEIQALQSDAEMEENEESSEDDLYGGDDVEVED